MKGVKKYKLSRRLGAPLFEKCQSQKFMLREQRKKSFNKILSDYGKQLIEKQKLRFLYGINEGVLKNYVKKAVNNNKGLAPVEVLTDLLERRLDSIVYRMGLGETRRQSRQIVSHGHMTVNGRKVTIPSMQIKDSDVIGIREGSKKTKLFLNVNERLKNIKKPVSWVSFDSSKLEGSFKGKSELDDIINLPVVFEYYSR